MTDTKQLQEAAKPATSTAAETQFSASIEAASDESSASPKVLDAKAPAEDGSKTSPERVVEIEGTRVVGLTEDDENFYVNFTKAQRRRVRTKIDIRLLPTLCVLYLFAQLDRSNIGNAKIEGFKEDTGLTDPQYNIALAVFFIPYFFLGEYNESFSYDEGHH